MGRGVHSKRVYTGWNACADDTAAQSYTEGPDQLAGTHSATNVCMSSHPSRLLWSMCNWDQNSDSWTLVNASCSNLHNPGAELPVRGLFLSSTPLYGGQC